MWWNCGHEFCDSTEAVYHLTASSTLPRMNSSRPLKYKNQAPLGYNCADNNDGHNVCIKKYKKLTSFFFVRFVTTTTTTTTAERFVIYYTKNEIRCIEIELKMIIIIIDVKKKKMFLKREWQFELSINTIMIIILFLHNIYLRLY